MGINDMNLKTLEWVFSNYSVKSVLELGAQNFYQNYSSIKYGCYADQYYKYKGVSVYDCIDINGENNARNIDLSKPYPYFGSFDLVTDFGTCEHIAPYNVEALYNCWKLKYDASDHLIVSSNPATGHWEKHGYFYFTLDFYRVLAELTGMKILKLEEQYAMCNYTSGKEICCVFDKSNSNWVSVDEFKKAFEYVCKH
jgi:hypothetical protein